MSFARIRPSAAVLVAALCTIGPAPSIGGGVTLSPLEQRFVHAINKTRVEHGATRVAIEETLVTAARAHSGDMIRRGYFSHGVFWQRLERFGVTSGNVGEDLGWDSHLDVAVPEIVGMWLRSKPHRDVLLSPKYRDFGVGVSVGPFEGYRKAIVVTADFRGP